MKSTTLISDETTGKTSNKDASGLARTRIEDVDRGGEVRWAALN